MQQVITQSQAKSILGGRSPHMPVEYEDAIKALAACITLDEAKYWDNKADALAAWAKIYHSPDAERKSRQLKLHAYRRMGQLAEELRPTRDASKGRKGRPPGAQSLLQEHGFNTATAQKALAAARVDGEQFARAIDSAYSPGRLRRENIGTTGLVVSGTSSSSWRWISQSGGLALMGTRAQMRSKSPRDAANGLRPDEIQKARLIAIETAEWLDEFERHLPKTEQA